MKHTPGPWTVSPIIRKDLGDDPMGEYVIREAQDRLTPLYWKAKSESYEIEAVHDENAANARLMSAAPDLLTQLQMLVRWAEDQGQKCEFAKAVIARATQP